MVSKSNVSRYQEKTLMKSDHTDTKAGNQKVGNIFPTNFEPQMEEEKSESKTSKSKKVSKVKTNPFTQA